MTICTTPPVIDLSDFENRKDVITKEMMRAATTIGFFYVASHGIPEELIDRAFDAAKEYSNQPLEEKLALPRTKWATRELLGLELNALPDGTLRESSIACHPVHKQGNGPWKLMEKAWPKEEFCPNYKKTTLEFMEALPPVANKVLTCLALGLGLPEDYFVKAADITAPDNYSFIQYHKYPSLEGRTWKEGINRITAHTDESMMTLLFPGKGSTGLELAAGKDGKAVTSDDARFSKDGYFKVDNWTPCPPIPGTITINIGDPLQYWSDGILCSNYHRVRMPRPDESLADRYSIGYFVWPRDRDVIQGPLKKYTATNMVDFMKIKGQMYDTGFNPDPAVYEAHRHLAFGAPAMPTVNDEIQVN